MELKHTKEPWIMNCTKKAMENSPTRLPIESEDGVEICLVYHSHHDINIFEYQANALLIKSAPAMLKFIIEMAERYPNSPWIYEEANALIKKATEL